VLFRRVSHQETKAASISFLEAIGTMSTTNSGDFVPGFFPEPKHVELLGGDSELSQDVRLVTSNVLPLQRKAMRGILTGAGVRVVANKKKYVIEASVVDPAELDLADVPEAARDEYYELEVSGSLVFIRTASQAGALWGTQGVAHIYRALARGAVIPNLLIRDWPSLPNRGIFVENKWGPDRMTLGDWRQVIDRLAALKMNRIGVGLYGCWGRCRFENRLTEFLMTPVPEHEEDLVNEHALRWYSPAEDAWQEETYRPRMAEEDFFGEVVAYGREKGVTVIPFVNSLGHNTLIPRMLPEISAKDAEGRPVGVGYCLSNPKTREFIETYYGGIIERYFPDGIEYFHIQMDEVYGDYPDPDDPHREDSPWCRCPECSKATPEDLLRDYISWLLTMLTEKGVGRVIPREQGHPVTAHAPDLFGHHWISAQIPDHPEKPRGPGDKPGTGHRDSSPGKGLEGDILVPGNKNGGKVVDQGDLHGGKLVEHHKPVLPHGRALTGQDQVRYHHFTACHHQPGGSILRQGAHQGIGVDQHHCVPLGRGCLGQPPVGVKIHLIHRDNADNHGVIPSGIHTPISFFRFSL
jgi:hypothetical protein